MTPPLNLIARVRRGELDFERLVEILTTRGYITEQDIESNCSFVASAISATRQDDFNTLFAEVFPDLENTVRLSDAATDVGGPKGSYLYALFNANVIDRERVLEILISENRKINNWLGRE